MWNEQTDTVADPHRGRRYSFTSKEPTVPLGGGGGGAKRSTGYLDLELTCKLGTHTRLTGLGEIISRRALETTFDMAGDRS